MEAVCPELNPIPLAYGFEPFWEYDVLPDSAAAKAAPEFDKIRRRAIALLSTPSAQEIDSDAIVGAGGSETARNAVTVS
jgi:hypothetical protein